MTAGGYGCEFCGGQHPVNWLVTRLAPSATIPLCGEDFPVGIIPLLAVELGVDVQRLYDAIKRFTDREVAREAKAAEKAQDTPAQVTAVLGPDGRDSGDSVFVRVPHGTPDEPDVDPDSLEAEQ